MATQLGRRKVAEPGLHGGARSRASKVAVFVVVLVLVGSSGAYGFERLSTAHFYPDTRIGGVLIGSRSTAEAATVLHDRFVLPLHKPIRIVAPDFKKKTSPWKMGMRLDVDAVVRDALVSQQVEPLPARIWHRAFGDGKNVEVRPSVDERVFDAFLKTTIKKVNQDPQDARLEVVEGQAKLRVIPHEVGRKVERDKAKERILDGLAAGASSLEVPVKVTQPALTTESFKRVILISTSANTLKLYKDGELVKKYAVATGTGGYPTPHGQFRVTVKRMNPTWYNPGSDWSRGMPAFIPPGRNNPLGTRALNLNASGIRIHGSPDAASIGTNASHGCIRMHIGEAEDLFERVEVGTPVLIVY